MGEKMVSERSLYLLLGYDDLGGEPVLGVGDGMVQQADAAHHLPRLLHLVAAT